MHTILPAANRRLFLQQSGLGLGGIALAGLLGRDAVAADTARRGTPGVLAHPHHAPKAKRIISLFMAGGPSHLELFDDKPLLLKNQGREIPDSVRGGQRLTGMSGFQSSLPLVGSFAKFARHGQSGATVSELLPNIAKMADDLTFVKSVHTDAINTTRRSRCSRPGTNSPAGRASGRG